jgi:hypothetical protein
MNRFLHWLRSLSEAEKSVAPRPVGMSRRSFLATLGIASVSVSMGGILQAKPLYSNGWVAWTDDEAEDEGDDEIGRLVDATIMDVRSIRWVNGVSDLEVQGRFMLLSKQDPTGIRFGHAKVTLLKLPSGAEV